MYRRILLVVDRSGFGTVLPTVAELARRFDSAVRLLSLREDPSHSILESPRELLSHNAERELVRALRAHPESPISTTVREGSADDEIVAEAAAWGADLLVMGRRRKSWISKSVDDRIDACIARTGCPVLVLPTSQPGLKRPTNPLGVGRGIVAVDGSALAESALDHGASLCRLLGVPLTLARVIRREGPPDASSHADRHVERGLLEKENADAYLQGLAARLRGRGIEAVCAVVREDDPARGILQVAGTDLIIMTSHARQGLMRILMGSVANRVVEQSYGPVLVIPPTAERSGQGCLPSSDARETAANGA